MTMTYLEHTILRVGRLTVAHLRYMIYIKELISISNKYTEK